MSDFEQPEILAEFDRSYGGRTEQLAFERSSFKGRPVFWLRIRFRSAERWYWVEARSSSSGRFFSSLNIKARELRGLGLALLAAADEFDGETARQPVVVRDNALESVQARRPNSARERAQLDKLAEHPVCNGDDDSPF